jgi:hypothetical protein
VAFVQKKIHNLRRGRAGTIMMYSTYLEKFPSRDCYYGNELMNPEYDWSFLDHENNTEQPDMGSNRN